MIAEIHKLYLLHLELVQYFEYFLQNYSFKMDEIVKNNPSNQMSKGFIVTIILLLLVILVLIYFLFYYYRQANPTNPATIDERNPYCLRITCNSGESKNYHNVTSDPQQDAWVTLNYCSANAPSSGMIYALEECSLNKNSQAWTYFHSANDYDPTKSNIDVYKQWYNDKFSVDCGLGWVPYKSRSIQTDELSPIIERCAANI